MKPHLPSHTQLHRNLHKLTSQLWNVSRSLVVISGVHMTINKSVSYIYCIYHSCHIVSGLPICTGIRKIGLYRNVFVCLKRKSRVTIHSTRHNSFQTHLEIPNPLLDTWKIQSPQQRVPGFSPCMDLLWMKRKSGGNCTPIDKLKS